VTKIWKNFTKFSNYKIGKSWENPIFKFKGNNDKRLLKWQLWKFHLIIEISEKFDKNLEILTKLSKTYKLGKIEWFFFTTNSQTFDK